MMYVRGDYVPVKTLSATQLRMFRGPAHWTTHKPRPSGRFCLQAYCADPLVPWRKQWRVASGPALGALVPTVVSELEAEGPSLAHQLVEAAARAEARRREWENEVRRQEEERERARQAKARQAARADLLAAIDAWDQARRVQDWLSLVEKRVQDLPPADREQVLGRLQDAKSLVGGEDALMLLKRWKAPDERL